MLTTAEVVAMLRECLDADTSCFLSSHEVQQVVARLNELEQIEVECNELLARLETSSPED